MSYFLAKTEPQEYSIEDLSQDQEIPWTGVENPQAKAFLRSMKKGDLVYIYHSREKTVAGLAVVKEAGEIPVFGFKKSFPLPRITLAQIKAETQFATMKLVRQSRLSVMDVPDTFVKWVEAHVHNDK